MKGPVATSGLFLYLSKKGIDAPVNPTYLVASGSR